MFLVILVLFLGIILATGIVAVFQQLSIKKDREEFGYLQAAIREGVRHAQLTALTASTNNKPLTIDEKRRLALEDAQKVADRAGIKIPLDKLSLTINSIITN